MRPLAAFQAGWHGGTVTIWTSRSGRQTEPPLTPSQIVDQAAITAMLAVAGAVSDCFRADHPADT